MHYYYINCYIYTRVTVCKCAKQYMHITCTAELYIFITHAWYAYMYSMFINIITKRVMQVRKKLGYRILFVTVQPTV